MRWNRRFGIAFPFCIFALEAETVAAIDVCPYPALTQIAAAPTSLVGGLQYANVTLTFATPIPVGCPILVNCYSSNAQVAVAAVICPASFQGNGTAQATMVAIPKVVDESQNVTLVYQATAGTSSASVGQSFSTAVTVTPVALRAFTLSPAQVEPGQTAVGTVLLDGSLMGSLGGSASVNISVGGPSNAVQVPSSVGIACCTTDGAGHSKGTFNITALPVAQDTNVGIVVNRPNQATMRAFLAVHATTPTLSVQDVRVSEPRDDAATAAFTFALSRVNPAGASVAFRMTGQTATRTSGKNCDGTGDFVLRGGVVSFGPAERTKTVTVPVCHDTRDEADETFRIDLSNPIGLLAPDTVAIGTIVDND